MKIESANQRISESANQRISESANQRIKRNKFLGALSLVVALAGCSTAQMAQFNKDLSDLNVAMASALPANSGSSAVAGAPRLASPPQNSSKQTELVVPADKAVAQAMEDALPVVKKVIAIHQCATEAGAFRLMNALGVPGKNFQTDKFDYTRHFLVGGEWKYHDAGTCPSVQVIDQWSMPALNALRFRVIYFADDSGESSTFIFLMKKAQAGNWQLQDFYRAN